MLSNELHRLVRVLLRNQDAEPAKRALPEEVRLPGVFVLHNDRNSGPAQRRRDNLPLVRIREARDTPQAHGQTPSAHRR
jgi:hypothetical protein